MPWLAMLSRVGPMLPPTLNGVPPANPGGTPLWSRPLQRPILTTVPTGVTLPVVT